MLRLEVGNCLVDRMPSASIWVIGSGSSHAAVKRRQMITQGTQVKEPVYAPKQVIAWDVLFKIEGIEKLIMVCRSTHHDLRLCKRRKTCKTRQFQDLCGVLQQNWPCRLDNSRPKGACVERLLWRSSYEKNLPRCEPSSLPKASRCRQRRSQRQAAVVRCVQHLVNTSILGDSFFQEAPATNRNY